MKLLLTWILYVLTLICVLAGIFMALVFFDLDADLATALARAGLMASICFGFAAMFSNWRDRIIRSMPPRHWTPPKKPRKAKKQRKSKAAPEPASAAPERPQERQLAPVPMARPLPVATAPVGASMPPELQRFIEAGAQAVTAAPTPQEAPKEAAKPLPEPEPPQVIDKRQRDRSQDWEKRLPPRKPAQHQKLPRL